MYNAQKIKKSCIERVIGGMEEDSPPQVDFANKKQGLMINFSQLLPYFIIIKLIFSAQDMLE